MKMKIKLPSIVSEPREYTETIFDGLDVSETTRKEYLSRVRLFLSYVGSRGFNQHSYLHFKRYLEGRSDYSVSTKNKYLTTARVFLRELQRRGKLPFDVTYNVKHFRQSKRHKREGLTDREVQLLGIKLKFLPDTPRNSRLRALFSLLAFQGLRQIEIVRLDVADINLEKGVAFVCGKGEDDKEPIYLTPATTKTLKEYMKMHKLVDGTLFRSMGNRKKERLSTMTIKREMGELFYELGIKKTVHGFRHFYVTELLKSMDVRDVRKFSRHRSMEMLIVYDDEVSIKQKAQHVFQAMEKFVFS
ncbi:MAG: putative integrase [Candidatus Daviesbacteria bacterium GW2011_GWB1_41_5]|uniref:Putative integrase n=1 Tax=Candidatus Daviesbacteria bacterium GW2011_GWB1_41_5 TaxID=1618429 RepID=A0A0G0WKD4_9BACT|nr:MAG: putative integrase [Candidatus Daviesbacteria bacterium GW2011_GWB1_41_5]